MRRLWKKRWLRIATWLASGLIVLLVFDYWTYPLLSITPTEKFARGDDGIWIRYTWYFGEVPEAEMRTWAAQLQKDGFKYAFFQVRALEGAAA